MLIEYDFKICMILAGKFLCKRIDRISKRYELIHLFTILPSENSIIFHK